MLNLAAVYRDAILAAQDHGHHNIVACLPATVYLLQRDTINQYRYMLEHYLLVPLDATFLQNSSIGTPYEKWAYFLNEDASRLSTAVHDLLRFTSRYIHETVVHAHELAHRYDDMKNAGNNYIGALVESSHKGRPIGLRVLENEKIDITPFATRPSYDGRLVIYSNADGGRRNLLTTTDDSGIEMTTEISDAHATELTRILVPVTHDVSDRTILSTLYQLGDAEIKELTTLNNQFATICRTAAWRTNPFSQFDSLHPSWCG